MRPIRLGSKRTISLFISFSVLFATSMSVALLLSTCQRSAGGCRLWTYDSRTSSLMLERNDVVDLDGSLVELRELRLRLSQELNIRIPERKVQSITGNFNMTLDYRKPSEALARGTPSSNDLVSVIKKDVIRTNDSLEQKTFSKIQDNSPTEITHNRYTEAHILKSYSQQSENYRTQFSCSKLFGNDSSERKKVSEYISKNSNNFTTISSTSAVTMLGNCETFRAARGYDSHRVLQEEKDYPLAFIILVHRDFEHLERLLRVLYRPQNVFCIHVDAKVNETLKAAVSALVKCFPNVVLASQPQNIVYAHATRLMADIVCMKDLQDIGMDWRYLINMAATELPLRTNLELVRILQEMGGLNDVRETFKGLDEKRVSLNYEVVNGTVKRTNVRHSPPPHNLTITKGMAYNTLTRDFVDWVLTDQRARDLLNWSQTTYSPDEHYWATLNNLYTNGFLNTPGGFKGHPDEKGYISRYINWVYTQNNNVCYGRVIRHICILSALDLPPLMTSHHLAANKFDLTFDPIAYACMEERLQNNTRDISVTDLTMYSNMWWIKKYKTKEQLKKKNN